MQIVASHIKIPRSEFHFSFVRSSGPGGQNVNKLNTKAVMRWNVRASRSMPEGVRRRFQQRYRKRITDEGDLVITSQRFRDQRQNERDCLEKLRDMLLAVAHPPKRRKATKPTRASIERRHAQKRSQSLKKQQRQRPPAE